MSVSESRSPPREWTFQKSVMRGLLEGILATAAATTLLTYHTVPGLGADALLERIQEAGLTAKLAGGPHDPRGISGLAAVSTLYLGLARRFYAEHGTAG